MRRMARPREHDREVQLFLGLGARALGLAKDSSHLEEAHVPLTLAPVILDPADQAWEQTAAQMGFFGGQGIEYGHRVGAVRRTEGKRPRLEQAVATRHQLLAN